VVELVTQAKPEDNAKPPDPFRFFTGRFGSAVGAIVLIVVKVVMTVVAVTSEVAVEDVVIVETSTSVDTIVRSIVILLT
jgi:hypothetical protein